VKLDCEEQCFFYWRIFTKFQLEKYDFTHTRDFSWKNDPNSPDFEDLFIKIARFL
jgi:hypothetical protein